MGNTDGVILVGVKLVFPPSGPVDTLSGNPLPPAIVVNAVLLAPGQNLSKVVDLKLVPPCL